MPVNRNGRADKGASASGAARGASIAATAASAATERSDNTWRTQRAATVLADTWRDVMHVPAAAVEYEPATDAPSDVSAVWKKWMANQGTMKFEVADVRTNFFGANTTAASGAAGLAQLMVKKDKHSTVGNIIQRSDKQMDIQLRRGAFLWCDKEEQFHIHPFVKTHTLQWGNSKLKNTKASDHEAMWNLRFETQGGYKVTCGYSRHRKK